VVSFGLGCAQFSALKLVPGRNEKRALGYVLVKIGMSIRESVLIDNIPSHAKISRYSVLGRREF